jgi:hypothetical protein
MSTIFLLKAAHEKVQSMVNTHDKAKNYISIFITKVSQLNASIMG